MTKGRAAMWTKLRACAAVLWAFGLTAACGQTHTTESGETHFVTCDGDADCTNVNGAHRCDGGLCRGPANDSADGGNAPTCQGCGESECAAPGSCTLSAACRLVDCGNAIFDDNACVRPACQLDADCPDDERCLSQYWGKHYNCVQNGNACECEAGHGLFPINVCSPVTLAGSRGAWQNIVVTESAIGDPTKRIITPDGAVTLEKSPQEGGGTSTAQLSVADLEELTREIDGSALRLGLADPSECPVTKELDVIVDLNLDTGTLSKNVAGCVSEGHTDTRFSPLIELVRRY